MSPFESHGADFLLPMGFQSAENSRTKGRCPLRNMLVVAALLVLGSYGCSSKTTAPSINPSGAVRTYNGTASVGDFMTLSIDPVAHTIHYSNMSNGDAGTVPFTVNADGTYSLADTTGNLLAAYEVPNFVLLVQAARTGPHHDTMALVTAVKSSPISPTGIANHSYNYMQFRTASGGMEIGSVNIDGSSMIHNSSYWPFGASSGGGGFNNGSPSTEAFQPDSSGTFMRLGSDSEGYDYVFGTPNGIFAVDTQNGAILGLAKAGSKDFDPNWAGTYKSIYYQKVGAHSGLGNVESGTPSLGKGAVVISAAGLVTVTSAEGAVLLTGTLTPVADTPWLYGPGKLQDPCWGLFVVRATSGSSRQDFFISFLQGAVLFSSFRSDVPADPGTSTYDYFYGSALK